MSGAAAVMRPRARAATNAAAVITLSRFFISPPTEHALGADAGGPHAGQAWRARQPLLMDWRVRCDPRRRAVGKFETRSEIANFAPLSFRSAADREKLVRIRTRPYGRNYIVIYGLNAYLWIFSHLVRVRGQCSVGFVDTTKTDERCSAPCADIRTLSLQPRGTWTATSAHKRHDLHIDELVAQQI
jgi:hypothetical protein